MKLAHRIATKNGEEIVHSGRKVTAAAAEGDPQAPDLGDRG